MESSPVDKAVTTVSDTMSRPIKAAQSVVGALQNAAKTTGVDFGFLLKTAMRESSLNPGAHAKTSSAAGLFQFVEQTWLGMMKTHGAKHGYEGAANAITKAENGRYVVNDPGMKAKVLNLRFDPKASASMAAEMTAGHAAYLKGRLGRDANAGELYAAHFLGAAGAGDLAQAVRTQPQANAVSLFPQAAHANPTIFYRDGRAVSVVDLMQNLSRHASGHGVVVNVQDAPKSDEVSGFVHARLENLRAEKMLMELAFGKGSEAATLFSAQLLSAFAPEPESKSSDSF